jgi:RimJ/RimL family protein N-acetyltransferase
VAQVLRTAQMKSVLDPASGLPIGPEIDPAPARRPLNGTVLEGRHVVLAPIDPAAQADTLYAEAHGPEGDALWLYLSTAPFADPALFRAYLERAAVSEDPLFFAIVERTTGRPLGHATYMRIEPAHRVIEVGNILYTPKLQRSLGATEAMYLMARHAFEELGYRRYEWKCNALNAPSRRAALRLGFTYEGTFRSHMIVKGRSRDTAWFSMLADEWPARKAAFERWLDPANFDEGGRQRLSLSALNASQAGDRDGGAGAGVTAPASS